MGQFLTGQLGLSRRSLNTLRFEVRALRNTLANIFNPWKRAAIAKIRKSSELSVNLGSGAHGLPGWVNIDMAPGENATLLLDIRRPLPFSDGSVRRIFAEHVIEHLDFNEDIPSVFSEFHRVLAPSGVVRIIVPDCERWISAYVSGSNSKWKELGWDLDALPDDIFTPMHGLNHQFHQQGEHLFGYDFETLSWALKKAGFSSVKKQAFKVSVDPDLAIDLAVHQPYSLYVEAIK